MNKERPLTTRFAPSPTGQMHIGNLAMCLVDYMVARSNGGKFRLRIEDTDQLREVEGAADSIKKWLETFGFEYDGEAAVQSKRVHIYKEYADKLIKEGKAYLDGGAVRFRAPEKTTIQWNDLVKGGMKLPGLERDPVIVKSNGIPPYNFAHIVDDTLLGTTHVIRGEEWLPSTAEHIQLREAVFGKDGGWQYAHLPVICKLDGGNKRKLSKRKDREALVEFFLESGYPVDAVVEYLLTIFNTDYELWRTANPSESWRNFNFRFEKIGSNSPLFDWDKLNDISKNIIAKMTCEQVNAAVKKHFGDRFNDKEYHRIFEILAVDRGTERPRKDIAKYSDIPEVFDYLLKPVPKNIDPDYIALVRASGTRDEWFAKVKDHCTNNGLKVRDYTQKLRVALTGREFTSDLYTISKLMLG